MQDPIPTKKHETSWSSYLYLIVGWIKCSDQLADKLSLEAQFRGGPQHRRRCTDKSAIFVKLTDKSATWASRLCMSRSWTMQPISMTNPNIDDFARIARVYTSEHNWSYDSKCTHLTYKSILNDINMHIQNQLNCCIFRFLRERV
jgi:hypothetical protein